MYVKRGKRVSAKKYAAVIQNHHLLWYHIITFDIDSYTLLTTHIYVQKC